MIKKFEGYTRYLSNFHPVKITFNGFEFDDVESAYQAAKDIDNLEYVYSIILAGSPGKAKKIGRKAHLRPDWEEVKFGIMEGLVRQKFLFNGILKNKLINTKNEYLQEGNYWDDTFWGVDLKTGKGENMLGKILMNVRNELNENR